MRSAPFGTVVCNWVVSAFVPHRFFLFSGRNLYRFLPHRLAKAVLGGESRNNRKQILNFLVFTAVNSALNPSLHIGPVNSGKFIKLFSTKIVKRSYFII
jgi:hypothetical protein